MPPTAPFQVFSLRHLCHVCITYPVVSGNPYQNDPAYQQVSCATSAGQNIDFAIWQLFVRPWRWRWCSKISSDIISRYFEIFTLNDIKVPGQPGLKCKSEGRKLNGEEEVSTVQNIWVIFFLSFKILKSLIFFNFKLKF